MTPEGPQCQHGPVECQMNRKMSCFSYYHSDQAVLLQYAACSEGHSALDIDKAATKCISDLGLDVVEVQQCENGVFPLPLLPAGSAGLQLDLQAYSWLLCYEILYLCAAPSVASSASVQCSHRLFL